MNSSAIAGTYGRTEKIINDDPHVKCSLMFGRGKFQNGLLIEPTEDYAFDPSDVKKLEVYRNKIWCAPPFGRA